MRPKTFVGRALTPKLGRRRRPQHFRDEPLAPARFGEPLHRVAADADARKQRLQRELRMAGRRQDIGALVATDQPPGLLVEIGIEARQHDGAVRQVRDGGNQFGGRRNRAGRTGSDHRRIGLARKPRGFGFDQGVAARGRFDVGRARAGFAASSGARAAGISASIARTDRAPRERARRACPRTRHAWSCRRSGGRDRRRARSPRPASARRAACLARRVLRVRAPRCEQVAPAAGGAPIRRAPAAKRAHRRRWRRPPFRQRPIRPRRCRQWGRCAAGSPRRHRARREKRRAPAGRRAGSADKA